jgi:hypothetical protein
MMNKIYIRKTQQNFKESNGGPLSGQQEAHGERSPHQLLCKKFHRHFTKRSCSTVASPQIKCNILWQGNLISVVKTFGKSTWALCNRERMEIVKLSRTISDQLINSTALKSMATQSKVP